MKNVPVFTAAGVEGASPPPWEGSGDANAAVTRRKKHVAITRNVSRKGGRGLAANLLLVCR